MTDRIDPARQPGASGTTTWSIAAAGPGTLPFVAKPKDVLDDAAQSLQQKRLILASWLSDGHALPDAPRWRQLENGAFVDVREIEQALRVLDDMEAGVQSGEGRVSWSSSERRRSKEGFGRDRKSVV